MINNEMQICEQNQPYHQDYQYNAFKWIYRINECLKHKKCFVMAFIKNHNIIYTNNKLIFYIRNHNYKKTISTIKIITDHIINHTNLTIIIHINKINFQTFSKFTQITDHHETNIDIIDIKTHTIVINDYNLSINEIIICGTFKSIYYTYGPNKSNQKHTMIKSLLDNADEDYLISFYPYNNSSQSITISTKVIKEYEMVCIKIPKSHDILIDILDELIFKYTELKFSVFIFVCENTGSNQFQLLRYLAINEFDTTNINNNHKYISNHIKKYAFAYSNDKQKTIKDENNTPIYCTNNRIKSYGHNSADKSIMIENIKITRHSMTIYNLNNEIKKSTQKHVNHIKNLQTLLNKHISAIETLLNNNNELNSIETYKQNQIINEVIKCMQNEIKSINNNIKTMANAIKRLNSEKSNTLITSRIQNIRISNIKINNKQIQIHLTHLKSLQTSLNQHTSEMEALLNNSELEASMQNQIINKINQFIRQIQTNIKSINNNIKNMNAIKNKSDIPNEPKTIQKTKKSKIIKKTKKSKIIQK